MPKQVATRVNKEPDIPLAYFLWLVDMVKRPRNPGRYTEFLRVLHSVPFKGIVGNDTNREDDGKNLRGIFLNGRHVEYKTEHDWLASDCTVLEFLIGLAIRMEYILFDENKGDRTIRWFWELVRNLGLIEYRDDDQHNGEDEIDNRQKLTRFLERRYSPNGSGGVFPLLRTNTDQRRVEIWYQMSEYLSERNQY